MANPPEGLPDDFLEQILSMPSYPGTDANLAGTAMGLQLGSGQVAGAGFQGAVFPLGLSLEQGKSGFSKPEEASGSGKRFREEAEGKASGKMVSGDSRMTFLPLGFPGIYLHARVPPPAIPRAKLSFC